MNVTPCGGKLAILRFLAVAFILISACGASAHLPQNKSNETDAIARQLLDKFADADKTGVIVMDFEPAFGEADSFGPWLADQLTSSFSTQGQGVEIVHRTKLREAIESQHFSATDEWNIKSAVALAKSIGATTVVVSSYGSAENGIGVSLAAYRVSRFGVTQSPKFLIGVVFGKIQLSQEVSAQLGVPVESLKPKDGVYRAGYGGVSLPTCIKCPIPASHVPNVDLRGLLRAYPQGTTTRLQFIVTAEGHTQNISEVQPVGFGFDEQLTKAVAGWEFKAAVDADNKPVPVTYPVYAVVNFK